MNDLNITLSMEEDHQKIASLFSLFFKNHDLQTLQQLKWTLERHILIEEKEILTTFPINDQKDQQIIDRLLAEHQTILNCLSKMLEEKETKTTNLNKIWQEHEEFEKEVFYPKLEQVLTEEQKKELSEKVNTLIL